MIFVFFFGTISFIIAIIWFGIRMYLSPPTKWCRSRRCLVGKTALITGANAGIGYETALDFAARGAKVILACRDKQKGDEARRQIMQRTGNENIFVKIVDFASFASVRAFAREMNETEDRLDILVNNVGMAFGHGTKTEDGYDLVMQVNYYSHFLLTILLLRLMVKSGEPSRIVNISSLAAAYVKSFDINRLEEVAEKKNLDVYADSKLCNIVFTKELALRLWNTKITTYSVHPGNIRTDILKTSRGFARTALYTGMALFYKPVEEGAQTTVYCSVEKNIEQFSGRHFDNCRLVADYRTATDPRLPEELWQVSEKVVQLKKEEQFDFDAGYTDCFVDSACAKSGAVIPDE